MCGRGPACSQGPDRFQVRHQSEGKILAGRMVPADFKALSGPLEGLPVEGAGKDYLRFE